MSRFSNIFLRERLGGRIQVAGFGKHPAWDDHLDDIGLCNESLVILKQLLYLEGITGQLASGAWDRIESAGHSVEFDHRFVWAGDSQSIVGAILASKDAKGRSRFPLVLCVQTAFDAPAALTRYLVAIETLAKECLLLPGQEEVRRLLEQANLSGMDNPAHGLGLEARAIEAAPGAHPATISAEAVVQAAVLLAQAAKPKGFSFFDKPPPSTHLRIPAVGAGAENTLNFWCGYMVEQVNASVPYLAIAPAERTWVDLLLGQPQPADWFCLKADDTALPIASRHPDRKLERKLEEIARTYLAKRGVGKGTDKPKRSFRWFTS
jgi:hypothetical protein